ncbi:MAG: DUF2252 family protein [Terriglobia bacterium]|jgi:uncharacterized protein (DUF2252 family)
MRIKKATKRYEAWLGERLTLVQADLALKHSWMAEAPFPFFLRATFYRWAQVWPDICPDLTKAPRVLAVGDLHVENFGTWRDVEGRLIWGVNDFDEAFPMAYTNDLVRLAVSAHLAIAASQLALTTQAACKSILSGYHEGLEEGGKPFVLEENDKWLREAVTGELRDPVQFWGKMNTLPTVRGEIPKSARKALEELLPERGLIYRVAHRVAGLGSLGRERHVAIADWGGGRVAREAKAMAPSACVWANEGKGPQKIFYEDIITKAARVLDPFVHLRGKWIVRRLSPDCSRIELAALPEKRDEQRLLHAMGFETANIHLGSKDAIKAVRRDLGRRKPDWLHEAVHQMTKAVLKDWEEWKKA